jgi:hypothetical protein
MKLLDLAQFGMFKDSRLVKVLRHRATDLHLWTEVHSGRFQAYQNVQSWDVFGDAQYIISFIAERDDYAKFVGVWEVLSKEPRVPRGFRYRTKQLNGFEDLTERLVVRWGGGARSWGQWLHRKGNKEISELLPAHYVMEFPGFHEVSLGYSQLRDIISHSDAHREWHRMLSSVSGVYVILDTVSGTQYVGSAYGQGGILGRWRCYTKNPSGGNKRIKELLTENPGRHEHFQFSILRVLEPGSTKEQVIAQETLTKRKLGSRAFGLNEN